MSARVTLLSAASPPDAADFLIEYPLKGVAPEFVSCAALTGLRLTLPEPVLVRSLRLWFLGCAESETWNSWLRSPRLPRPGTLALLTDSEPIPATELRFQAALQPGTPTGDATMIELRCDPRRLAALTVRFPPGPWALARIELGDQPFAGTPWPAELADGATEPPAQPDLPRQGDAMAEQLRQIAVELGHPSDAPPLDDVWRLAAPYRGGALLGWPEGPLAYQLWDGGLVLRPTEAMGLERGPWGERILLRLVVNRDRPLRSQTQSLRGGYLPIAEVELDAAGLLLRQTAFVDGGGVLRLGLRLENRSAEPATVGLQAVMARRLVARNDRTAQAEVHAPLGCSVAPSADGDDDDDVLRLSSGAGPAAPAWTLAPGEVVERSLRLSLDRPARSGLGAGAERESVETESAAFLATGATLELPDPHLMNLWRALLLHNRLFVRDGVLRYGLFPGLYEDALFGVEEGWNIVAMAQYGHGEAAAAVLERTFFDAEFLKKEGPHHQYRNGLAITYALDVHALNGDQELLRRLWPTIRDSADWIAAAFASTKIGTESPRPAHFGLMPRHIYGGDLRTPAYSLYASSACWRGLRDAARLAQLLGEPAAAATYGQAAATARADLLSAAQQIYRADAHPPFLPFRTDETAATPSSGEYYQLFASLILETAAFGWRGRWARLLTDYLEQTGRQILGVPRFDVWFGRLGVDAEYARGSQLAALHRRDFDRFLLGLVGQVGLSCDPCTFVSPETAVIRFTRAEQCERLRVLATQAARADSDPCSAGTGVMLQYLRYLLACEERDDDDLPTGLLWLGAAAPAAWFQPGQSFAASNLPTLHGPISFRCSTTSRAVIYEIELARRLRIELEAFYRDRAGKRRSRRSWVDGAIRLTLPR